MANKAFLSPLGFKFQVKKLPTFIDYIQSVNFPSISMGETEGISNPFQKIVVPGEHMEFSKLFVKFKLDANMVNYREIFDWIQGLGKPDNFNQYAAIVNQPAGSGTGAQVDATLTILDSDLQPNLQFYFYDLYPTQLSGFELNYTLNDVEYITADVEFSYREYNYKKL